MLQKIMVTRSSMPSHEEYCEEIKKLWDSHWLTNSGVEHKELRARLEEYLGCPSVTLFTNGHLALEYAIAAFGFPKGAEVITTPFTFASTTHAIVRSGLTPVFCDVREDDYTLDADKLGDLVTERTAAIVPVHVYGNLCDTDKIGSFAKKRGLKVIFDAAHAFGVKKNGVSAANFGDASMFSFHATKVFNTIEGGAVCTTNEELAKKLEAMKNFGQTGPESVEYVGGNAKMSEFQAAMGILNLRHLEGEIAKRGAAVRRYRERLGGVKGVKLCPQKEGVEENFAYFPVVFDGYKASRDEIFARLAENGVTARKYFFPPTNSFACYKELPTAGSEKTPVAAYFAERVLTLPLYADLLPGDVDRICDIILDNN